MTDSDDPQIRLGELIARADDLGALREAIEEELAREDAGELLLSAVLALASVAEARKLADVARDPDGERGEDEELEVADPFADPDRPFAAALDSARQLRRALVEQDDLRGLLAALSAISNAEAVTICFELGLEALWERRLGAGAE